ncbi:hypothetical protein GCM10007989_16090 [Devosia pacifica]|uniref:Mechanosensitive ion channel MscS domain-containing protein n=1 Tax=Devosia pacifica TaxID=1335967 RepID=A0A918S4Y3_9HYPH|nr:mechanosensitive ion channel domain-containing protein [Devosia pacifica]GHA21536.1 hypothetical protein GCM10007989_16090 [Devosia pacifica]
MFRPALRLVLLFLLALSAQGAAVAQEGSGTRFFEVEELNAGLAPPPEQLNRDTPQATLEAFYALAEREDWQNAAHLLDLSPVPEVQQARLGPRLAEMLYNILQRGMVIDWGNLPDRPDALDAFSSSSAPLSGEPRRSIRLSLIDLDNYAVPVRVARLKPENADPAWVFSQQTVENIPQMHEIYGPTRFEQMLPGFLQQTAFWTLAWWEVVALPVLVLLALLAAAFTYRAIGAVHTRSTIKQANVILDTLRFPMALLIFVATFVVTREAAFTFSGPVNAVLGPIQTVLIIIAVALIAVRIVDGILDQVARRNLESMSEQENADERDLYTNISAARRAAIVIAFLFGLGLIILQLNVDETLGFSLIASASGIGLILAFAARKGLADVMASLQIAISKSARIGDAVLFAGNWCYVEKIKFTYVQLRSWDGRRVIVPVSTFTSEPFENWSKSDSSMMGLVVLNLDHRADVDKLRKPFEEFVAEDEDVLDEESCAIQVVSQDARTMQIRLMMGAADPTKAWNLHCRAREFMLKTISRLEDEAVAAGKSEAGFLPREREMQMSSSAS